MLSASAWLVFRALSIEIKSEELNLNPEPGPLPAPEGQKTHGAAPLLQGDLSCASQLCDDISLPRAVQLTFLMPSRSLFVHLLPKAVEKTDASGTGKPCCICVLALGPVPGGGEGELAVTGTRLNLSILGEPRPAEVSDGRRRALCSATTLSLQVSCPSWRDWSRPPSCPLWSISMGHWGACCGYLSSQGACKGVLLLQRSLGWSCFPLLCPWFPPSPQLWGSCAASRGDRLRVPGERTKMFRGN